MKIEALFNTFFISSGFTVLSSLFNLLFVYYGIEYLGIELFGHYLILLLFTINGLAPLLLLGLPETLQKEIAQNNRTVFLIIAIMAALVISVLATTLLYFFVNISGTRFFSNYEIALLSIFLPIQLLLLIVRGVLRGKGEFILLKKVQFIISTFVVFSSILLIANYPDQRLVLFCLLLGFLAELVILLYNLRHDYDYLFSDIPTFSKVKNSLHSLAHFSLWTISSNLSNQFDRLIVSYFLGTNMLSVFHVVTRIPYFIKSIFSLLNPIILTEAARLHSSATSKAFGYIYKIETIYFFALPVFFGLMIFSEMLLYLWLGEVFAIYAPVMMLFFLGVSMTPIVNIGWNTIAGQGKALDVLTKISMFVVSMRIILLASMIYLFGLFGIPIAVIVANSLAIILCARIFARSLEFSLISFYKLLGSVLIVFTFHMIIYSSISTLFEEFVWKTLIGVATSCSLIAVYYLTVMCNDTRANIKIILRTLLKKRHRL